MTHQSWRIWRFEQMAVTVNDRIDNPSEADVDRYVGLEHLDPDSLKIRRWGAPSDVEATKLLFKKGDIIFGRRRAYQRKLAVADFDGICSAHAMVLRAKPEVVLPEFLPFFMQSDLFMNRAVEISVGSLSPTINWKTLAAQEFALPPLEEQRRIAKVFVELTKVQEALHMVSLAIDTLSDSFIEDQLYKVNTIRQTNLGDLSGVQYGLTVNEIRRTAATRMPYLRVANVLRNHLDLSEVKNIGFFPGDETFVLRDGDVLLVEGHANATEIGRAALWEGQIERCLHQNHLIRVRCGASLEPEFLVMYLNSSFGRRYFLRHAKSTSGLNTINSTVVRNVPIPLRERDKQVEIVSSVNMIRAGTTNAKNRLAKAAVMKHQLLLEIG